MIIMSSRQLRRDAAFAFASFHPSDGETRGQRSCKVVVFVLHKIGIQDLTNSYRCAVRDYTLRTFTTNDAPEPPPPPGINVLCCHHVAAVNGANGVDFVRLPRRAMQWAPVPIRHAAGIAAWQPS